MKATNLTEALNAIADLESRGFLNTANFARLRRLRKIVRQLTK